MLYLREYRPKADRLFDHLPWVALIGPGLLLNKDGSFQKTLAFRGPDLASSTEPGLVAVRAQLNNALRRLGSRWCLHIGLSALSGRRNTVDAQRGRLTTRNSLLMPCAFQ